LITLALLVSLLGAPDEEEAEEWVPRYETPFEVPFVDRPITLPEDMFGLLFDLGVTQLSRGTPLVAFDAGAGYGVTSDLEVGVILVPLTLSSDESSGLGEPRIFAEHRLVGGVFELSARLEVELPLSPPYRLDAAVPFLVHLGGIARLDGALAFRAGYDNKLLPEAGIPLELTFQIARRLALSAGGYGRTTSFERPNLLTSFSLRAAYTIEDEGRPWADLGVLATSPAFALAGELPDDPSLGKYFAVALVTRFFIPDTTDYGRLEFD
jgi:hypothetical protein